jgi:hypothetical protein
MQNVFTPRLDILPPAQQRLWPELAQTPGHFTLYGGTAIALRLGHRQSVDFDFFSPHRFEPHTLIESVPYLKDAVIRVSAENNLTVAVHRGSLIQLQFFGNFDLGQVEAAEIAQGARISVASLTDLAGMKVAVVTQRAELRDYLDIYALLTKADISLSKMLTAASVIYGDQFNPLTSLKAIAYYGDPNLAALSAEIRTYLSAAVRSTDLGNLPVLEPVRRYGQKQ